MYHLDVSTHRPSRLLRRLLISTTLLVIVVLLFADLPPFIARLAVADVGLPDTPRILVGSASDQTLALAWGDVDDDGDLDLAIANGTQGGQANQLYRNCRIRHSGDGCPTGDSGARFSSEPVWTSDERDASYSLAWGDADDDGDLDLAVGNNGSPSRIYRNTGGNLATTAAWSSEVARTTSVAWGDVDGDGDLDLAVGNNGSPSRIYRNTSSAGQLSFSISTPPLESQRTTSLAWGDVDGDGDLDLAVGNNAQPNRIYRNDNGVLTVANSWQAPQAEATSSLAWGDVDGDGDLDLAVGNGITNGQANRLYRNDTTTTTLVFASAWTSQQAEQTSSIVWGDGDGDGDLDLAVANNGQPSRIYRSCQIRHTDDGCSGSTLLTADSSWNTTEARQATQVAWSDVDGDGTLDLSLGILLAQTQVFLNSGATLTRAPVWQSTPRDTTNALAWGDVNGDGDLDLVTANDGLVDQPLRLYANCSVRRPEDQCQDNQPAPLTTNAVWESRRSMAALSLAWGDVDGDSDLDLAVGTNCGLTNFLFCDKGLRIYVNDGAGLATQPGWQSAENEPVYSLAWGDADGDGDLDLAAGKDCTDSDPGCVSAQLYRNDSAGGTITFSSAWAVREGDWTLGLAWGDTDGDGDLDLATGNTGLLEVDLTTLETIFNGSQNRLYLNDGGLLATSAAWKSVEVDPTSSIAWGDMDGDGDLDLAAGNLRGKEGVYGNCVIRRPGDSCTGASLTTSYIWSSRTSDNTTGLAWADMDNDSDLDLVAANGGEVGILSRQELCKGEANQIYRNAGTLLELEPAWTSTITGYFKAVAPGDVNGDGDLELASGSNSPVCGQTDYFFRNNVARTALPPAILPNNPPTVGILPIGEVGRAALFADATIATSSEIAISYVLRDIESDPVREIRAFFSLDGGGKWLPALPTSTTRTTNLTATSTGVTHVFVWDTFGSGFFGRSDNVVFRIEAYPGSPAPKQAAGLYQRAYAAGTSLPFRVRGTQIQVVRDSQPVKDALVFRQPADTLLGTAISSPVGPLRTDSQGFLQGRGELRPGDRLVALAPITHTAIYSLYQTSAAPTGNGLRLSEVITAGVQTLNISSAQSLILFNLDVSLEWDTRADTAYLERLAQDLRQTSELLFDWTDGQAALGDVTIYQDKQRWNQAHIRVYASSRLRPNASQGGIVTSMLSETVTLNGVARVLDYEPGQIRMGKTWTRYGDTRQTLGDDWPRALAHELGHFALFLDDNYLGLDEQGRLISLSSCPGAMSDPYGERADALDNPNTEFHPSSGWLASCARTLSNQLSGRADWQTIKRFYDLPELGFRLNQPPAFNAFSGPNTLPLAVTQVRFAPVESPQASLGDPVFALTAGGAAANISSAARAFLLRADRLVDLGGPKLTEGRASNLLSAPGARSGDRLCVFDLAAVTNPRLGCAQVTSTASPIELHEAGNWQPDLRITPETSRTIRVDLEGVAPNLRLHAALFPSYVAANDPLSYTLALTQSAGRYRGTFVLTTTDPSFEGYVHIFSDEPPNPARLEVISEYTLGGSPGLRRKSRTTPDRDIGRGNPGLRRKSRTTPVLSADGQVLLFSTDDFPVGTFYALQSATRQPEPPPWAELIGSAYRLTTTPGAPDLDNGRTSINMSYLGSALPQNREDERNGVLIYFLPEGDTTWQRLPTSLNDDFNEATALTRGPGLYALMRSVAIKIEPDNPVLPFPVQGTRAITAALASLAGNEISLYSYNPNGKTWGLYDTRLPAVLNSLETLSEGQTYLIYTNARVPLNWLLRGPRVSPGSSPTLYPPASFYGELRSGSAVTATAGLTVTALVDGEPCGSGTTVRVEGRAFYSVSVLASNDQSGCGVEGATVGFEVAGQRMLTTARWISGRPRQLTLNPPGASPEPLLFLPLMRR